MDDKGAIIGVSDHGGWAVLATVATDGTFLDRRRVDLVEPGLPKIPHHSEGQTLPISEAVALVERVLVSAQRCSTLVLNQLAGAISVPIRGIALRRCPPLPPTIAERIQDYRAHNVADWVMYRQVLSIAAEQRSWWVDWYDPKNVMGAAEQGLRGETLEARFLRIRKSLGPPWNHDHRLAMAAALAAANQKRSQKY